MKKFSAQLADFSDKLETGASRGLRDAVLNTFGDVVENTPVDTGRARGNWGVGIGQTPAVTDNTKPKYTETASVMASATWGDTVVIANNLPYIRRLEFGYSKQGEAMLRNAIDGFDERLAVAIKAYTQ